MPTGKRAGTIESDQRAAGTMQRPIIIDTDPGIDDAVAILLAVASPELEVLGLVAVAGNLPLAATARNASAILELGERLDIPVYAGCPRPIAASGIDAADAHGGGGLGDLVLPEPAHPVRPEHGGLADRDLARRRAPKHHAVRSRAADQYRNGPCH